MFEAIKKQLQTLRASSAVPVPVNLNDPLGSAIADAQTLIAFAAQSRRNLEPALIGELNKAIDALGTPVGNPPSSSAELRTAFWAAYDQLAVAMAPLSALSIRASQQVNQQKMPRSLLSPPAVMAWVAVGVFIFCILIQSFWVSGKDLLDRADAIEEKRAELVRRRLDAESARKSADTRLESLKEKRCESEPDRSDCPFAAPDKKSAKKGLNQTQQDEKLRLQIQIETLEEENIARRLAIERNLAEEKDLGARGQPLFALLKSWHGKVRIVCEFGPFTRFLCLSQDATCASPSSKTAACAAAASAPATSGSVLADARNSPRALFLEQRRIEREKQEQLEAKASDQRSTAHEVRLTLATLGTYVIPLFMGLLGALAYVLQTMTAQLRDHTYLPFSASAAIIRLCLGGIAGVFGTLSELGAASALKALPPLFIPFVFGYGIEILFSLLNRIVRTFTQPEPTPSKGSG